MPNELLTPPIVENPFGKHPAWVQRNSFLVRGINPPSGIIHHGTLRPTYLSFKWDEVVPGPGEIPNVMCKTFSLNGISSDLEDGAEVAIQPGALTPPQHVSSETVFSEIPLRGRLIFLSVSPQGEFKTHYFEVSERENSPLMAQVSRGWIMSWYALRDQRYSALFMEHETPGFSQSKLPTIPDKTFHFNGTTIPQEFWQTRQALSQGQEEPILAQSIILQGI